MSKKKNTECNTSCEADGFWITIRNQQATIAELICMLERGCIGTSGLLIQTSDQAEVIKWRKESQELINKVRGK